MRAELAAVTRRRRPRRRAGAARARAGPRTSALPARAGMQSRCAASRAMNASRTSAPTSKAAGPIAGPSQATSSPGSHSSAATVASTTPAASPRQPACATPTRRPSRPARNTGRQSATSTAQTLPGRERHGGIGRALRSPRQRDDADAVHLLEPGRLRRKLERRAQPSPVLGDGGGLVTRRGSRD